MSVIEYPHDKTRFVIIGSRGYFSFFVNGEACSWTGFIRFFRRPINLRLGGVCKEAAVAETQERYGMTERDPRIDPHTGDVLRKGSTTRTIQGVSKNLVFCIEQTPTTLNWQDVMSPYLSQFRKWAATAEVVKRGVE